MTAQISAVAVQNAALLRAIKAGGHASATALAEAAGVGRNNINRQVDLMETEGLIAREPGKPTHEAALTAAGEAALQILAIRMVPFDLIEPWAENPRTQFNPADDEAMARSIGDQGILQPLILRPRGERYEVIIGERRRRAAVIAVANGWQQPDFLVKAEVRELSDDDALVIAGVENLQREDMHWMDEAKWYLRLSARLSGPAIERLVGGARKKRSIQDYIKCARELSPAEIARTYLPDGHADQLSYVKARELTGEKKEKPALELSPRQRCALVEIIYAGLPDGFDTPLSGVVETRFYKPPAGGPVGALQDKKLIAFGFNKDRAVVCRTTISEEIGRFLAQLGFDADPTAALARVQAEAIGELQARALGDDEYATEELNAPEPPAGPVLAPSQRRVLREIAARSLHRQRVLDDWVQADPSAFDDPDYKALSDLELTTHRRTSQGVEVALSLRGRDFLKAQGFAPEDGKSANSCTTSWLRTDNGEHQAEGASEPATDDPNAFAAGEGDRSVAPDSAAPAEPDRSAGVAAPTRSPDDLDLAPSTAPGAAAPADPNAAGALSAPLPRAGEVSPQATEGAQGGEAWGLPPMLAIVAVELAHAIAERGRERGPGTWAVEVLTSYYRDGRGAQGVQTHRAWAFMPLDHRGDKTVCALTQRCVDWLAASFDLIPAGDGRLIMDDELLAALQARLGVSPVDGGRYSTYWLNPPATVVPEAPQPPEGAQGSPPEPQPRRDAFMQSILDVTAEDRALARCTAALREARVGLLSAKSRKLAGAEADQLIALIDAALAAAGSQPEDA